MNLDQLEQFVMDIIDVIFRNPLEFEAEACKSTVAYRFALHRKSLLKGVPGLIIHHLPPETFRIPTPKIHRLPRAQVEETIKDSAKETPE